MTGRSFKVSSKAKVKVKGEGLWGEADF